MQFVSHARHSPSDHNSSVGGARAITVGRLCSFPFDNTHAAIADTSAATRTGRRGNAALGNWGSGTANAGDSAVVAAAANRLVQRGRRPEAEQLGPIAR